jgi:hypothetical protein
LAGFCGVPAATVLAFEAAVDVFFSGEAVEPARVGLPRFLRFELSSSSVAGSGAASVVAGAAGADPGTSSKECTRLPSPVAILKLGGITIDAEADGVGAAAGLGFAGAAGVWAVRFRCLSSAVVVAVPVFSMIIVEQVPCTGPPVLAAPLAPLVLFFRLRGTAEKLVVLTCRPVIVAFGLKSLRARLMPELRLAWCIMACCCLARACWAMYSSSRHQKPPFPGSSAGRGIFLKHLFSDRLCRIEFYASRVRRAVE